VSEQENEVTEPKTEKVYPGNLARYVELRETRNTLDPSDPNFFAACVAEELAGLSYILDGIRYSARQGQR
jgi:hypothetical protein